jgi:GTPase SAR1 family protein
VVAIGDASVGKTSIVDRLMQDFFNPPESPTVGANWQPFLHDVGSDRVELQPYTAGQEAFRSLEPLYHRNATGAVAVYDVTRRSTFQSLDTWISSVREVAGVDATVVQRGA